MWPVSVAIALASSNPTIHTMQRRTLLQSLPAVATLSALSSRDAVAASSSASPAPIRPRRLRVGDTIGLVSPASAVYEREPITRAIESLQALGFRVREAPHLRGRRGNFAGTDAERAADINDFFRNDDIDGILALTGGSGCNRIVDKLDYSLIQRRPKFFGGFSDLTCLINAIQRKTGLVTFHCPVGVSDWNPFSVQSFRSVAMEARPALLEHPVPSGDALSPTADRLTTLRSGRAQGRLVGGNLTVLAAMAGSPHWPDFRGAVLVLEDINEIIYRLDRCLSTLRLAGAFDSLAGVVLGQFVNCGPGDDEFGALTLDEVFDDYFLPLGIPAVRGVMVGHISRKHTLPIGAVAEIDASTGAIQVLAAAVS